MEDIEPTMTQSWFKVPLGDDGKRPDLDYSSIDGYSGFPDPGSPGYVLRVYGPEDAIDTLRGRDDVEELSEDDVRAEAERTDGVTLRDLSAQFSIE